jgi:hypothetical protein
MESHKNLVLHIGGETFLLSAPHLSRTQLMDIESLAGAAFDDYAEELEEMSVYQLCEWFQEKVRELYQIELKNLAIDYEVTIKYTEQ